MDLLQAMLIFAACFIAADSEPHCSKFAYEEQTLEKMIRTEIKCEQLNQNVQLAISDIKDSFTKLENNVKTALKEIQSALDTNKADRTNMKDAFDQQMDENKDVVRNHEARLDGMLHDLQQFQTFIYNNISGLMSTPRIAFNARDVGDGSPSAGQTIVFKTTLINEGQAYDTTTGVFTAPVSGLYSFSAQFCTRHRKYITAALKVESSEYGRGFVRDYGDATCNSFNALAVMEEGNTAKIQIIYADGRSFEDLHRVWFFSGYLVE